MTPIQIHIDFQEVLLQLRHRSNAVNLIVKVLNPLKAQARTFDECRGYVVAAYQENLEKRWINELKQKYPVNINKNVLDSLVKKP